ncbi:hypothetical protein E2C01_085355 [Portunus trituberculatus]|uniref:Uncharacterized protein n=1 Tax=Portunus trituberculatus TaxID=210409 RepID=A0A5B7JDD6_PORTR|nr:hypothetical protein [Portunus trituberculatus]
MFKASINVTGQGVRPLTIKFTVTGEEPSSSVGATAVFPTQGRTQPREAAPPRPATTNKETRPNICLNPNSEGRVKAAFTVAW